MLRFWLVVLAWSLSRSMEPNWRVFFVKELHQKIPECKQLQAANFKPKLVFSPPRHLDIKAPGDFWIWNSNFDVHFLETCFNSTSGDGRDYRGTLNYTTKGVMCQPWNERWPHDPEVERKLRHPGREGLGKHNFCRNPRGRRARPWCYTTLKSPSWQYCDVRLCNATIISDGEDTWNKARGRARGPDQV